MLRLREKIVRYVFLIAIVMTAVILIASFIIQFAASKKRLIDESSDIFEDITDVLEANDSALSDMQSEYKAKSFNKADCVSYMISQSPSLLKTLEHMSKKEFQLIKEKNNYQLTSEEYTAYKELNKIATLAEVDEINILTPDFDAPGGNATIIFGTVTDYYGYDLNDGAQMAFFKQMVNENGVSRLYQEVMPNTAKSDPMQYSMVWSSNKKEFLIEIGTKLSTIEHSMKQYELSYVFFMFKKGNDLLYAVDAANGVILASTNVDNEAVTCADFGVTLEMMQNDDGTGFNVKDGDVEYFCVSRMHDGYYLLRIVDTREVNRTIISNELTLMGSILLIVVFLFVSILIHINKFVIRNIENVNTSLRRITLGNLEESINIRDSLEFSELSDHINAMVSSLLTSTDKISFVLNQSEMHVGVYEYNEYMKRVRFTENLPSILQIDEAQMRQISSDVALFKAFMSGLFKNVVENENGIFHLSGKEDVYIRIKETEHNNGVLGIVADVTEEINKRRKIEAERDIDILTGLYNRRAVERKLDRLFDSYKELDHGLMILLDADGLKKVNDKYGHENGDAYLCGLASVLREYENEDGICGRIGGDEFILFLFNRRSKEELEEIIGKLAQYQDNVTVRLKNGEEIPLGFSFGYAYSRGYNDYRLLEKLADDAMYRNKRKRKMIKNNQQ
ncbi:MAG: diguanylate cyclase [Clostridia bacterium]|nr:diguanylate cyclase [Clostridia bacterium]